jgi:hypothetical protein
MNSPTGLTQVKVQPAHLARRTLVYIRQSSPYGRRLADPTRQRPGQPATGVVRKPLSEWIQIQHDAYPAYISREQYLANRARLADNAQRYTERCGRGVPRQGAAWLQGLATCGQCGRAMKVVYKTGVRYACYGLSKAFGEPACAHQNRWLHTLQFRYNTAARPMERQVQDRHSFRRFRGPNSRAGRRRPAGDANIAILNRSWMCRCVGWVSAQRVTQHNQDVGLRPTA